MIKNPTPGIDPARLVLPARPVHTVFLHCSASNRPEHDDVTVMRSWHLQRGWSDVGYHAFVTMAGVIQPGRPLEVVPAAQEGHNTGSIAICAHGLNRDDFTPAQLRAVHTLCMRLRDQYAARGIKLRFRGHCEVSAKACPVFDYRSLLGLDPDGHMVEATPRGPFPRPALVTRALKRGDHGEEVEALQRALASRGLYTARVDGDFGPATERAVLALQVDARLPVTGIADQATAHALGLTAVPAVVG